MEIVELAEDKHPFFLGVQFHPELKSRPLSPSPPFQGFFDAAAGLFKRQYLKAAVKRSDSAVSLVSSESPRSTTSSNGN